MKTLPEAMQSLDSEVMSAQPPGPEYEYDDPGKRLPHLCVVFCSKIF